MKEEKPAEDSSVMLKVTWGGVLGKQCGEVTIDGSWALTEVWGCCTGEVSEHLSVRSLAENRITQKV